MEKLGEFLLRMEFYCIEFYCIKFLLDQMKINFRVFQLFYSINCLKCILSCKHILINFDIALFDFLKFLYYEYLDHHDLFTYVT